jgi:hypothetical protein
MKPGNRAGLSLKVVQQTWEHVLHAEDVDEKVKLFNETVSGCKCFRRLKGCSMECGCGIVRIPMKFDYYKETKKCCPQSRKRRKHAKSPKAGRNFIIGRGEEAKDVPSSLFEERLCGKCALYLGETKEISVKNVTDIYNNIIVLIKKNKIRIWSSYLRKKRARLQ